MICLRKNIKKSDRSSFRSLFFLTFLSGNPTMRIYVSEQGTTERRGYMGLKFRKSIKMGPVRVNLSSSGIGYSVGTKGARISKSAKGKTKATFGIPGSGLSYSKTIGSSKKKRKSTTKKQTRKPVRKTAAKPVKEQPTSSSFVPHESSPATGIVLAVISFFVVALASFIVLFIADVIVALFSTKVALSRAAIGIIVIASLALGAVSSVITYRYSVPEKSKEND